MSFNQVCQGGLKVNGVYAVGGLGMNIITGTTDSNGRVTFTWTASDYYPQTPLFSAPMVVRNSAAPAQATFAQVLSEGAGTCTVQVWESKTTGVLLGGSIEGLEPAPAGITVRLLSIGDMQSGGAKTDAVQ